MARRKNPATARPAAARSAAHSAPAPAPVPGTGPAPDSPAAAVHAALTARPGGATTAIIADAAGIGRPAVRDALTTMETAGTVTRTKGGKPGIPDTWTLAAAEGAGHEPGAGPGRRTRPRSAASPATTPPARTRTAPASRRRPTAPASRRPATRPAPAPPPATTPPPTTPPPTAAPATAAPASRTRLPGRDRAATSTPATLSRVLPAARLPTTASLPASRRTRRLSRRSLGASSRSSPPPPLPRSC